MKRDLESIKGRQFDVLIVGGGAFGACALWEAALRNYSVLLVEADDFGSGTSANSLKFVHGGIRYLQHLDIARLRASCRERSALLRIAPHLVKPQPVAIPTYGHGREGKAFLGAGFAAYDALTLGKNRGIRDTARHIPRSSFMGRAEVLRRFGGIEGNHLTGAAVFSDAQMYHPPRLVLSFVMSAVERGAVALNYVEASALVRNGDRISGVLARDRLTGEEFEIRSRVVLNAAGPWSEDFMCRSGGLPIPDAGVYSRDTAFVIDGTGETEFALAVQGASVDKGSVIGRAARHLFVVPWRGRQLVGVWHIVYEKGPDAIEVPEQELERILAELNGSFRSFSVKREDIRFVNAGLVPFGDSDDVGEQLNFGKKSHLVDSAPVHGLQGLVTLIGVRHTMARGDAAKAVDIIDAKLKRGGVTVDSAWQPLVGGDVDNFEGLVADVGKALANSDSRDLSHELAALYGSRVFAVLDAGRGSGELERVGAAEIIGAQIETAVRDEMAVTLADLVFRRTPLAAAGHPGDAVLRACAEAMGNKLGWSERRKARELAAVIPRFPTATNAGRISAPAARGAADDRLSAGATEPACHGR